ncbi:protein DpdG [Mycolicibacterium elephantis]|uniref:protein DpdG n=1 Tax=Mycolicibacterium elephantis TaxID=81858 RepID=UPI003A89F874
MTIINATGSLPGLGRVMLNNIISSGNSVETKKLFEYLLPEPRRSASRPFANLEDTLIAMRDAGLVTESEGSISASQLVEEFAGGAPITSQRYRRLLQRSIATSIADDPWVMAEGDKLTSGTKDLTRALSWFLAQDALSVFTWAGNAKGALSVESTQMAQLPGAVSLHPFSNGARWNTFTRWSTATGMSAPALNGAGLHPDATVAIRDVTRELNPGIHSIDDFLGTLTRELPVISGGALHRSFLQYAAEPDPSAATGLLDTSIAQALLCMEEEGLINILDPKADTSSRTIGLGNERRRFTHVQVNREDAR